MIVKRRRRSIGIGRFWQIYIKRSAKALKSDWVWRIRPVCGPGPSGAETGGGRSLESAAGLRV